MEIGLGRAPLLQELKAVAVVGSTFRAGPGDRMGSSEWAEAGSGLAQDALLDQGGELRATAGKSCRLLAPTPHSPVLCASTSLCVLFLTRAAPSLGSPPHPWAWHRVAQQVGVEQGQPLPRS